ncbi:MAG TPA: tetraacyldisaccharide 4'-kinase [Bacillota bacterium]|nr:tetraacyldisaccharide 4'-kinase [Bacillota bacterium]
MDESYLLSVIRGERRGWQDRLVLLILSFLEPIYGLLVFIRKILYRYGFLRIRQLPVPVISIGNLVAGGTGKTPLSIYLARTLTAMGQHPGILLRGYRGKSEGARLVTKDLQVEETGDEAQLLTRSLPGLPVAVGADRYLAGQLAVGNGASVAILDDGLQYLGLYRDLEVVLLRASDPWDNGHLIPRGLLREGRSGIRRADLIILTNVQSACEQEIDCAVRQIRHWNSSSSILCMSTQPLSVQPLLQWWRSEGQSEPANDFLNARAIGVFTAIGYPEKFFNTLKTLGARIQHTEVRPDHDQWTEGDFSSFSAGEQLPLLTTEKDAVKLGGFLSKPIAKRIFVLRIQSQFSPEDTARLEAILRELK